MKRTLHSEDICVSCGGYVPEGRQVCSSCEEAAKRPSDKTPDGIIRKHRASIVRSAKSAPAAQINTQTIYELTASALALRLLEACRPETQTPGHRNQLIQAIAETRVLVERLVIVHCSGEQDADAYRFHLERAARNIAPIKDGRHGR